MTHQPSDPPLEVDLLRMVADAVGEHRPGLHPVDVIFGAHRGFTTEQARAILDDPDLMPLLTRQWLARPPNSAVSDLARAGDSRGQAHRLLLERAGQLPPDQPHQPEQADVRQSPAGLPAVVRPDPVDVADAVQGSGPTAARRVFLARLRPARPGSARHRLATPGGRPGTRDKARSPTAPRRRRTGPSRSTPVSANRAAAFVIPVLVCVLALAVFGITRTLGQQQPEVAAVSAGTTVTPGGARSLLVTLPVGPQTTYEYALDHGSPFLPLPQDPSTGDALVEGLQPGTTYTMRVRSCGPRGCTPPTTLAPVGLPVASGLTVTRADTFNQTAVRVCRNDAIEREVVVRVTFTGSTDPASPGRSEVLQPGTCTVIEPRLAGYGTLKVTTVLGQGGDAYPPDVFAIDYPALRPRVVSSDRSATTMRTTVTVPTSSATSPLPEPDDISAFVGTRDRCSDLVVPSNSPSWKRSASAATVLLTFAVPADRNVCRYEVTDPATGTDVTFS